MKKFVVVLIALLLLTFSAGCGNDKQIGGVTYKTYGLLNKDVEKTSRIRYEPIWGNIIWGCILFQTVIAPVYFFGFSTWEPISLIECKEIK